MTEGSTRRELTPWLGAVCLSWPTTIGLIMTQLSGHRARSRGREGGRRPGRQLVVLNASNERDIDAAFFTLARQHVDALLVDADALFVSRRQQPVTLAAPLDAGHLRPE